MQKWRRYISNKLTLRAYKGGGGGNFRMATTNAGLRQVLITEKVTKSTDKLRSVTDLIQNEIIL